MKARLAARPAILEQIPKGRSAVIEASAGTGKTFTLEHLIVDLILRSDVPIDRILVVTFTEKATQELRARVRAKLEALRSGVGADSVASADGSDDAWVIDETSQKRLELSLQSFDSATITTIHAFCQRVLRENAFVSGRMLREQQVDGRDAFGRAMREALRRDIACEPRRALWLSAALGEGWSIERIEALLWDCAEAHADLRPVFDADALTQAIEAFPVEEARRSETAAEMRAWGMHQGTAKATAGRLLKIADAVEQARATRSVPRYVLDAQPIGFGYLLEKLPASPPRPGPAARVSAAALALARTTPTFAAVLAQTILPAVRGELTRRKREAGQYDFDDMLALVAEALRGPRAGALAAAMRERWRFVLIDEFQDTDETQWSIFRRAFFQGPERGSVLYLVGDPKQSIYRFRGADVLTYLRARDEVVGAGGERVALDQNYRATPALVAAQNAIFDQLASEPVFTGPIDYAPVTSARLDRALVDGDGRAVAPVGVMRFRAAADTPALGALGRHMGREIRAITDPSRPWKLDGRPLGHSDIYVLTRTAREGRAIAAALRASRVPYAFYKQDGLCQTDEARDVRTLLLAIEDPSARGRRLAAWLTPFFGLPLSAIDRARELPNSHPWAARLAAWKALAGAREFGRLFESILRDSGIVRREIFFGNGERQLTNYVHLCELLLDQAHRAPATLRDLIHVLSGWIDHTRLPLDLEGDVQRLETERRAVQIMTIHKAKGLEAPVVFVAGGFWAGSNDDVRVYHEGGRRLAWVGPSSDSQIDERAKDEEREEEQRLMYVALTRAMGRLYLPFAAREAGPDDEAEKGFEPRPMRGAYAAVNRRIAVLLKSGNPLLSLEDVVTASPMRDRSRASEDPVADWVPPASLLRQADETPAFARLRRGHAGPFATSYTRMAGEAGPARRPPVFGVEPLAAAPETELRRARASGIFLHEVLERISLASFAASTDFGAWSARPDVAALFEESLAAHRIERGQRGHAERLVWGAYTTALRLPEGGRLSGIAAATRVVREMDFVFAVPESPTGAPHSQRVRGYVRGSIDLAFEHSGQTYFVDWKSDSLPTYSPEALEAHVKRSYQTQAELYAAAIVKLLGVRTKPDYDARFGGLFYCFLRGLDGEGRGVWTARPSWDEVLAGEAALRDRGPTSAGDAP